MVATYGGDTAYASSSSGQLAQIITPSAPTITSAVTASVERGAAFSYTITSIGSKPTWYDVSNLPPGLTFDFLTISGTPTTAGTAAIVITATNSIGSDVKTLQLTITKPAGTANTPPTITSAPVATPNPGRVGEAITFTAAGEDPDGDIVGLFWNFGDGTTGSGASTTHTYAAAGIYNVTLTVRDADTSATAAITVAVNLATGAGGDGNGNPTSTELTVLKGAVKINFAKDNMDALSFSGTVPMGAGFAPASKTVSIIAGGYRKDVTFDAKGKAKLFSLTGKKAKDGKFTDATLKFSVKLSKVALAAHFADLGFENTTIKKAERVENITLLLVIGGNAFSDTVDFDYKASEDKNGSGKLIP